jgi:hypothetical protein
MIGLVREEGGDDEDDGIGFEDPLAPPLELPPDNNPREEVVVVEEEEKEDEDEEVGFGVTEVMVKTSHLL